MAQPTLPIPSGTAKYSFFDRKNGKNNIFRLESRFFSRNIQFRSSCDQSVMEVQKRNIVAAMAATGETMVKPSLLTTGRRCLTCQYRAVCQYILPTILRLRERFANLESSRSIQIQYS